MFSPARWEASADFRRSDRRSLYERKRYSGTKALFDPVYGNESGGSARTSLYGLPADERGDRFLICSDGVSDMVPVDFLETMMQQTQSTAKCVDAILTAALDAGGKDNITAIVLEINR